MEHLSKMHKEKILLTQLGLEFEKPYKVPAYIIRPKSLRYNMRIALIVTDVEMENYSMMLFLADDLKKEIEFYGINNILANYNSLYALGRRLFDNQIKTRKDENTETVSGYEAFDDKGGV